MFICFVLMRITVNFTVYSKSVSDDLCFITKDCSNTVKLKNVSKAEGRENTVANNILCT